MQVWGCSLDEANHRVHDFFESRHFAVGILPIPGKNLPRVSPKHNNRGSSGWLLSPWGPKHGAL